jgi:large subunit ribosomal protein L23
MNFASLIKRPIITEKSSVQMDKSNKYVFEVSSDSTKSSIIAAIREAYGVTPVKVNVLRNGLKQKRSWVGKKGSFFKPSFKKAIITLKDNDKINLYKEDKK